MSSPRFAGFAVSYLSQAIHYWEIGDGYVMEISNIAERCTTASTMATSAKTN
jgi:hypothetical protein